MKLYTNRVVNKQFHSATDSQMIKYSWEYYVLGTLRYLYPAKYKNLVHSDSPDLQDCGKGIGIEVVAAVSGNEAKANGVFLKLRQETDYKKAEKYKRKIENCDSVLVPICDGKTSMMSGGTDEKERRFLQSAIRKKSSEKLQLYRCHFRNVGLAIMLPDRPTQQFECCCVNWAAEEISKNKKSFDFLYIISETFCIYYDLHSGYLEKKELSEKEKSSLRKIGRMTAEGELSLTDYEWQ